MMEIATPTLTATGRLLSPEAHIPGGSQEGSSQIPGGLDCVCTDTGSSSSLLLSLETWKMEGARESPSGASTEERRIREY